MRITYKSILDKIAAEVREAQRKCLEIKEIVINQYEADQLRSECGYRGGFLRFPVMDAMPCYRECERMTASEVHARSCAFRVMDVPIRIEYIRN